MARKVMSAEEHQARSARSARLILWFAMISMTMMFGGLTSAFIVSSGRADWLKDFEVPSGFYLSTVLIILSSVTFHLAKKAIEKDDRKATTMWLMATLAVTLGFVGAQFYGFDQIVQMGYFFTGAQSNITTTFLYVVAVTHLLHLAGGFVALFIIIYNHYKQKYNSSQTLGIELGATYWHFLDLLWIYLFLFLVFYK